MKEIKSSIDYTLTIDPAGKNHSLQADTTFENGIVAMLMTEQVLAIQTQIWQNQKETAHIGKKEIKRIIRRLESSRDTIKHIVNKMMETYEGFKQYESETKEKQLKEQGILPKDLSELSNSDEH